MRYALGCLLAMTATSAATAAIYENNQVPSRIDSSFDIRQVNTTNPMISALPEHSLQGPGYICEFQQLPALYTFADRYYRPYAYRDPNWISSVIYDRELARITSGRNSP